MDLPPLADLIGATHVVTIPMRVPFRGVTVREAALVRGPAGWGEFSPFPEYGAAEAARWLSAAVESAWEAWPAPLRHHVPVNATVPAVPAADVPGVLARFPGCTTAKVKVAEPGQAGGGAVVVTNAEGKMVVHLSSTPESGRGFVDVMNAEGEPVVALGADKDGGRVAVSNTEGQAVVGLESEEDGGMVGVLNPATGDSKVLRPTDD